MADISHSSAAVSVAKLADQFRADGWLVQKEADHGPDRSDLVIAKGIHRYAVEFKSLSEGRPDRALALLSQAILQAQRHAGQSGMSPLAILQVGSASPSLWRKVEQFHREYAPGIAIGLIADSGWSHFVGAGLEGLNAEPKRPLRRDKLVHPRKASDLFTDLNQWLLKVLLAPELPENLLRAPRSEYCTVSELANAAQLSTMSASRFVRRLREEGFLEDSGGALHLVRRRELFRQWQSAVMRSSPELRMSFLIPGDRARQLSQVVPKLDGCIGLFAAADLLKLGHVSGVATHVYVRRLLPASDTGWPGLVPSKAGEKVDVFLRQANFPESLFRGAVQVDGMMVADAIQVWLDSSAHPSRGAEQADHLEHMFLSKILGQHE
jgi:hypothetical protein